MNYRSKLFLKDKMESAKLYNDAVHGHIEIPDYCWKFIDTLEFQRLRNIKQLGPAYLVFSGATHTRFEHSIGVSYLANKMITTLSNRQPELKVTARQIKLVTLAGLLHDIGHGPFSHLIETVLPGLNHEYMSCKILRRIIHKYGLNYCATDILAIEQLILGIRPEGMEPWIVEIVANPKTSIDVDKFDYFQRDSKYANIQITYKPTRFFINIKVIYNHLAYSEKEILNVYELYHTRYVLFKTLYLHRVVESISLMIVDALREKLLPKWKAVKEDEEKCLEWYLQLTDNVVISTNIWKQICLRNLYKLAWEGVFENKSDITEKWITENCDLSTNDFVMSKRKLNFTHGAENPLHFVKFYKKGAASAFTLKDTSQMISMNRFQEFIVRIYSKRNHSYVRDIVTKLMAG